MPLKRINQKGFTLLELLVSVSIFIIIVTMAMGSLVVIYQANRQTASIRLALDNANFALNAMSRDIRLGRNFSCQGGCIGSDNISFTSFNGSDVTYKITDNDTISKKVDAGNELPLTANRYQINTLRFTQSAESPKFITIYMNGTVTNGEFSTDFDLQTSVSSRQI